MLQMNMRRAMTAMIAMMFEMAMTMRVKVAITMLTTVIMIMLMMIGMILLGKIPAAQCRKCRVLKWSQFGHVDGSQAWSAQFIAFRIVQLAL